MAADNLDDVLSGILEKLSGLPLIGTLAGAVVRLHEAIRPLTDALKDAFTKFTSSTQQLGAQMRDAQGRFLPKEGTGGGGGGGAGGGLSNLAKTGAMAAAALGALVVAINIAEEMFNKARQWVNLFNPGVIMMFQHHLDNLGATIGRAFVPLFTEMIGIVRSFTATLAPIMAQLVPVVQEFADAIGGVILTYLQNFGSLLRGMIPYIQALIPMWEALGQIIVFFQGITVTWLRVLALVVKAFMELTPFAVLVKVLGKAFESLNVVMKVVHEAMDIFSIFLTTIIDSVVAFVASFIPIENVMNKLKEAVQFTVRNMYVFAVMLARLAGLNSVADNLIKHVEGRLKVGDTAAQTPQIKGLEQLSKDLAIAAAIAGGAAAGVKVDDEKEFWKRTLEEMKAARENNVSVKDILIQIRDEILKRLPGGQIVGGAVPPSGSRVGGGGLPVPGAVDRALESGAFGPIGLIIGGATRPR